MKIVKILLSATILSAGLLPIKIGSAIAAPAVTGTTGCVLESSRQPFQPQGTSGNSGGGGGTPQDPQIVPTCGGPDEGSYKNPWTQGNFANTDSVNAAISNLQTQIDVMGGSGVVTDGTTICG